VNESIEPKFVFEEHVMAMLPHEEEIIVIRGKSFLVRPASELDVERVNKGYFCMD
jgi:hypothetical protein